MCHAAERRLETTHRRLKNWLLLLVRRRRLRIDGTPLSTTGLSIPGGIGIKQLDLPSSLPSHYLPNMVLEILRHLEIADGQQ